MNKNYYTKEKSNKGFYLIILLILGAVAYYMLNSDKFEKVSPTAKIDSNIFWNLEDDINVTIADNNSLKFVNAYALLQDGKKVPILQKEYTEQIQSDNIVLKFPEIGFFQENGQLKLIIEVTDSSLWNYFSGNKITKVVSIKIDRKKPSIQDILSSYSIKRGGTALTIFKIKERNLKEVYLETNEGRKFKVNPFYRDGFYISLFAWPVNQEHYRIYVVAKDKAGNTRKRRVRLYFIDTKYKKSYIKLSKKFVNSNKITNMFEDNNEDFESNAIKRFKYINENVRKHNEDLMRNFSESFDNSKKIIDVTLKRFWPLHKALKVASFGDHRHYYVGNKSNVVSESYHLGRDIASVAKDKIYVSNYGKVKVSETNGIYGKNVVVCHQLGVCSLYGHLSEILTSKDDKVLPGNIIGRTGVSGLAFGDHLHFGILVQGVEVIPGDWMDKKWVRTNITQVSYDAKKIIDQLTHK